MSQRKNFDYLIMLIVVGLVLGVVMVFSASYYAIRYGRRRSFRFIKQLQGAAIGLALMIILAFVDYHAAEGAHTRWLLLISIAFRGGALPRRTYWSQALAGPWVYIVQPSEVARFALLVFCADWLSRFRREVTGRDFRKFMRGMSAPSRGRRRVRTHTCRKQPVDDDRDRARSLPAGDGGHQRADLR